MPTRLPLAPRTRPKQASAGFTLFESVLVIVILGIISIYAAPKAMNNSAMTLDTQAKMLASDLQRAQLLATTTGKSVYFCAFSNAYMVQIADPSTTTCPASLPATPTTLQPVVVTLEQQATLSASPAALRFNSLGQPNAAGTFQINSAPAGSGSRTVSAAAVTGLVSVTP